MKYEYDSSGVYFYYFLLSILGLFLLPTTYGYLKLVFIRNAQDQQKVLCNCPACFKKEQSAQARQKRTLKNPQISNRFVIWLFGWIVVAYLMALLNEIQVEQAAMYYDPFTILDIPSDATDEQIRKQYKRLSLKWHPDKNLGDTKETAEIKYVEISKAYQTLTDEETKQNWIEYGHPDGRQSFSFGIALPTWVVDPSNSLIVLSFYAVLFGFLLPFYVGRWWGSSKKYTKDHVLNYTMGIFFQEMKENYNAKKMLELLCASMEFKDDVLFRGKRDTDAVMKLFREVSDAVYLKTGDKLELPKKYNAPYVFKAFTIMHAHLFRVPIDDDLLLEDSKIIVPKLVHISMKGLLQLCSAHYWLYQSMHCVEISRMLIQGVPAVWNHMESSDLMQLPHFSANVIKHLRNRKKPIKSVPSLMSLSPTDRIDILKSSGLDSNQVDDVLAVGREFPIVIIETAVFECSGESVISPDSLVTFVLKLKAVKYGGESNDAPSSPLFSKKSDEKENKHETKKQNEIVANYDSDNSDDESSKNSSKLTKLLSGVYLENRNVPVHCPYFPSDGLSSSKKRPVYLVWLANPRNNRIVGNPIQVHNLVPRFYDEDPSVKTVKFRFQAPPQTGNFTFTVFVMSDSYIGSDLKREVKLSVVDIPKDIEERQQKTAKEAWKDLEEEERIERELGVTPAFSVNQTMSGKTAANYEGEASDYTDTSSDEDSD